MQFLMKRNPAIYDCYGRYTMLKSEKGVQSNNEDLLAFMRSKWQVYYTCYKQKR